MNVVEVREVLLTQRHLCLVMELAAGGTLTHHVIDRHTRRQVAVQQPRLCSEPADLQGRAVWLWCPGQTYPSRQAALAGSNAWTVLLGWVGCGHPAKPPVFGLASCIPAHVPPFRVCSQAIGATGVSEDEARYFFQVLSSQSASRSA